MATRILIVEDERKTADIVARYLERAGYDALVARTGDEGLAMFERHAPELIVLDAMLPGVDGFEICRRVRERGNTPIIMLTARVGENDRISGLQSGADDYVPKPFSPRELVARVQAVLRRSARPDDRPPARLRFGALELDPIGSSARLAGRDAELTRTEYRVLEALASTPNVAWSRARLVERVFGWDYEGSERTIDTHVTNLRRKLAANDRAPRIATAFGVGYRLCDG